MKSKAVKFVFESESGIINTWYDVWTEDLSRPIEDIVIGMKEFKNWYNGKFIDAYIEFDNRGEYYTVHLDLKRLNKLIQ
jgi:hypothetical protein